MVSRLTGSVVGLAGKIDRPPETWVHVTRSEHEPPLVLLVDHALETCLGMFDGWSVVVLELTLKQPTAEGMGVPDEIQPLQFMEGDLMVGVVDFGATYAGQVTGGGKRAFYCFVPPEKPVEDLRQKLMPIVADSGYQGSFSLLSVSPSELYHSVLKPTARELRRSGDRSLIDELALAGDNHEAVREVSHWCYFADQATAEVFVRWSEVAGFHGQDVQEDDSADLPVCVKVFHNGTMVFTDINAHTWALDKKCSKLGGKYDGWETLLMCSAGVQENGDSWRFSF